MVSRALEVIHDRVNLVHPEAQFNEVLSVGYFEKQKMDVSSHLTLYLFVSQSEEPFLMIT